MSDMSASGESSASGHPSAENASSPKDDVNEPLWQRLLYMLGFWFLGNIAFSVAILLGGIQFIVIFLKGDKNAELARFSRNLIRYVWECLAFVVFIKEDKPFPFTSFPHTDDEDVQ